MQLPVNDVSETNFPLRQNFSHQYTTLQFSYFKITAIAKHHLCQKLLSDNKINTLYFFKWQWMPTNETTYVFKIT
jgi:hypothetical protein